MLRISGPTYRYTGERIHNEIVYIDDHCYDEESQSFPVQQLLVNNPGDHLLVFDHLGHDDVLAVYPHVIMPVYLADETESFRKHKIQPNWNNKTHCFNFMINKPRPHRIHLLEMIKQFGLDNYCHSLAWRSNSINDIAVTDYRFGLEVVMDRGVRNGSFRNAHTYQGLLQKTVFEPSCVSLITEPAYYERETIITEKTIMAMYAGTIPVWVGGWCIPNYLKQAGFDTFDDIVDHSYQNLKDPADRCRQAIVLNQDLLRYFDITKRINWECRDRLKKNMELLETNYFRNKCLTMIDQYSEPVHCTLQQMLGLTKDK
jgi:hypothetical protein